MPGRMEFGFDLGAGAGAAPARGRSNRANAWRLLVVGDFAGCAGRPALAERPIRRIDLDRFDAVMGQIGPRLALGSASLSLRSLDDLHPDHLWQHLPTFAALREARERGPQASAVASPGPGTPTAASASAADAGGGLLGALLGGRPASAPIGPPPTAINAVDAAVQALARQAVGASAVPDRRADIQAWNAAVDQAATAEMRTVLHEPSLQALEAAWRGVLRLLQNVELDNGVEVHLLDATAAELVADLVAARGDARQTALHRAVVGRWKGVPGAPGWDSIVGLHRFGPGAADMALLAAWSLVAEDSGCTFTADGDPVLAGDPAAPALAAWQALRRSPSARHIGLAAPRLLLRQPYGKRQDPIAAFAFEELPPGRPEPGELLWGAAALGVAQCQARTAVAEREGQTGDDGLRRIDDLPALAYDAADGERELQPVAESWLAEEALAALVAAGLMPWASHRHEAAASLVSLRSIAAHSP